MGIYRIRLTGASGIGSYNGDGPFGAEDILDKKCRFADHWSPACLIPADGAILKPDLQLTVIVIAGGDLFRQPGADGGDLYRPAPYHLAHHIDIVYPAIHDGAKTVHQVTVDIPHIAMALLVQV